ncbi:MAG: isoleucine--tRNA ligase [Bacillota bacterium]
MDYSGTLNLPKTDFPMKAGLPAKEPHILEAWENGGLYQKMREKRKGSPPFILHDGPPYANGSIHMGTALNKVLKDIINKYRFMCGYDIPYVPGWDTHGLPIEHQVIKTRNVKREEISDLDFRQLCRDYALHYLNIQREQFKRLGVVGDWNNYYITLDPAYEAIQIGVFGQMARKGYIYRGMKPVYWCPQCETALAEAEVDYQERSSPSIFVRFPVIDNKGKWDADLPAYIIIWTTTPWTIPANLAIALHPDYDYSLVKCGDLYYLVADELQELVFQNIGFERGERYAVFKGKELEGVLCRHPLYPRNSPVVLAEYVTLDQGSGCVHTAPGHGQEDYETGLKYRLPIFAPMDSRGVFTEEAGEFCGLRYDEGNKAVNEALKREKALLKLSSISHQYPHCWRCNDEVIFRATEQWFASIRDFRNKALQAVRQVRWIPGWGEGRMNNMIAERRDWCISRQRVWGVPLPIFYCKDCGEPILQPESIAAVQELFRHEGSDAWFRYTAEEILPQDFVCPACGKGSFRKEKDIMDVWFDSGSSHEAVLGACKELSWPADLYLEGSDQFRGWFQSSLLTAVATREVPPYRSVLCHGWVVDGEGRKMSKSLGNVIAPEDIIKNYGADILRLWVSSADFTNDVHLSGGILKQLSEIYRKIRNTCRFLLGNTFDFHPETDTVPYAKLEEIDRWALYRLARLVQKTARAYNSYEFHQVFHAVHNFAVVDMSNLYLNIVKDRLYVLNRVDPSRRAVQTVLDVVLRTMTVLIAPVLSFTAEDIWSHIPHREMESVLLADWPKLPEQYNDAELAARWETIFRVREGVNAVLEKARRDKMIGNSLEAMVELYPDERLFTALQAHSDQLASVFIVSACRLHKADAEPEDGSEKAALEPGLYIKVKKAPGGKCARCWMLSPTVPEEEPDDVICSRCEGILAGHQHE